VLAANESDDVGVHPANIVVQNFKDGRRPRHESCEYLSSELQVWKTVDCIHGLGVCTIILGFDELVVVCRCFTRMQPHTTARAQSGDPCGAPKLTAPC
jgi:hypothetical protein